MSDDTRDIAITALESGKSAHKRLDTINGQIGRLGNSHEKMREDFADANLALGEKVTEIGTTVAEIGATMRFALKVAGGICLLVISVSSGVTVYVLTHAHHASPPSQAAPQHQ